MFHVYQFPQEVRECAWATFGKDRDKDKTRIILKVQLVDPAGYSGTLLGIGNSGALNYHLLKLPQPLHVTCSSALEWIDTCVLMQEEFYFHV